jgi:ribosomal protein L37AE/L43A
MDRVIIKNADYKEHVCPYCASIDVDVDEKTGQLTCRSCGQSWKSGDTVQVAKLNKEKDWKEKFKLKRRRFRNEPDGIHQRMQEGMEGDRNKFRGMGTEESFMANTGEPAGW